MSALTQDHQVTITTTGAEALIRKLGAYAGAVVSLVPQVPLSDGARNVLLAVSGLLVVVEHGLNKLAGQKGA